MAKGTTKGKNFTTSEVIRMLSIVEDILTFGSEQWQNVASQFNANIPTGRTERDGDILKRKFQKLVQVPKPSGNCLCPDEVQRAKRLQYAIESPIAVIDLHDENPDTFSNDNVSNNTGTRESTLDDDSLEGVRMLCGTAASGSDNSPAPNTNDPDQHAFCSLNPAVSNSSGVVRALGASNSIPSTRKKTLRVTRQYLHQPNLTSPYQVESSD
ncbi:uncharacterized protein PITG_04540 [Phytophthora infestans T30-4]|uniref:DUF6818 domain-containing protein n=2 Tax=Phytophthora infestans TaxID=4787 RepID=D0N1H3_PHYIT|nr:uncharacterized protein PITG_04540 [Phytophthora infestans T30-4]EEY68152.1 conserved hypothetical protein [Phytophthora infestans T30-4]KAF4039806.1 hypothetical protein GN244_ATG08023 [Phytophthora infestans]KAF4131547.1 hypothetical protein GN958_ATG19258 [Phytophthora infestans]|eukprot:XP_002905311.1 conserved hypothetical protein [Phytophthora infestans T30-4]